MYFGAAQDAPMTEFVALRRFLWWCGKKKAAACRGFPQSGQKRWFNRPG